MDYKKAGVDIEAGYKSVELMKKFVQATNRPEVLGGIGGFSGAFSARAFKDMEDPVLLSGTDGVGTKLKLAMIMDRHDTIGIDCVAMCVNDVACAGGEPLFFLDYIACGKNYPEKIAEIVKGVAEGCLQSESALIGGGFPKDKYLLDVFNPSLVIKCDTVRSEDPDGEPIRYNSLSLIPAAEAKKDPEPTGTSASGKRADKRRRSKGESNMPEPVVQIPGQVELNDVLAEMEQAPGIGDGELPFG